MTDRMTDAVLPEVRALTEELAGLTGAYGTERGWYTLGETMVRGVSEGIAAAGEELAAGHLSYQVPLAHMLPAFRRHGERLNSLGLGMQRAAAIRAVSEELAGAARVLSEQLLPAGDPSSWESRVAEAADPLSVRVRDTATDAGVWHGAADTSSREAFGRTVIQYITLRSDDETPYETARAIRRESEALLRA